jgi:hypothetical protein
MIKTSLVIAGIGVVYLVVPLSVIYLNSPLNFISFTGVIILLLPSVFFFDLAFTNKKSKEMEKK